jgi:hypothetical protein
VNLVDRAIRWLILAVLPLRRHRYLPHWVKVLLNRWMRTVGDPPTDLRP